MHCRLLIGLAIALTACSTCSARLQRLSTNAGLEADPVQQGQQDPTTRRNSVRNFFRVNHPRVNAQSGGTTIGVTGTDSKQGFSTQGVSTQGVSSQGVSTQGISTLSVATSSAATANTNMASSGVVSVGSNTPAASQGTISVITPTISTVAAVPQSANIVSINAVPSATSSVTTVSINKESTSWPEGNYIRPSINFEFIDVPEMINAFLDTAKPFWNIPAVDFGGRMKRDVGSYRSEDWDKPQDPSSDFYERLS